MNNFQNKDRNIVIAGIAKIWIIPMQFITKTPIETLLSNNTADLASSQVLEPLHIEEGLSFYSEKPNFDASGLYYQLQVSASNYVLSTEKDSQLNRYGRGKYCLVWLDNQKSLRFMLNARIKHEADTGEASSNGRPAYTLAFTAKCHCAAYYFDGAYNILPNKYLQLT